MVDGVCPSHSTVVQGLRRLQESGCDFHMAATGHKLCGTAMVWAGCNLRPATGTSLLGCELLMFCLSACQVVELFCSLCRLETCSSPERCTHDVAFDSGSNSCAACWLAVGPCTHAHIYGSMMLYPWAMAKPARLVRGEHTAWQLCGSPHLQFKYASTRLPTTRRMHACSALLVVLHTRSNLVPSFSSYWIWLDVRATPASCFKPQIVAHMLRTSCTVSALLQPCEAA